MEIIEGVKIVLSGSDVEQIIKDFAEAQMRELGNKITSSKNEDGPFPEITFYGQKLPNAAISGEKGNMETYRCKHKMVRDLCQKCKEERLSLKRECIGSDHRVTADHPTLMPLDKKFTGYRALLMPLSMLAN